MKDIPPTPLPPPHPPHPSRRLRRGIINGLFITFCLGLAIGMTLMMVFQCAAKAEDRAAPVPLKRQTRQTYAVDGDSLMLDGLSIRLFGIDAPELNQTCDGQPVGQWAKRRLNELLMAKPEAVVCQLKGRDRYARQLAICTNGQTDIGGALVSEGLAFAYRRYSLSYTQNESNGAAGPVHVYHCMNPEQWRRK